MQRKINEQKKKEVEELKKLALEYNIIGMVNLENLPAFQLLKIKSSLRDKVVFNVTKKRLIKIAFNELNNEKKGIAVLNEKFKGIPCLLFTREEPFMLAKLIKKSRSKCAAKAGQKAPADIIIPAGQTEFPAGPMIAEFGQLGIKTQVVNGKIAIRDDKLIVKSGEAINQKTADMLSKLKIEPMEVGLDLFLTYNNGEILTGDVLFVDEQEYFNNIKIAYNESVMLAIEIGYACSGVIEKMIAKAEKEAKAIEQEIGELKVESDTSTEVNENREEEKSSEIEKSSEMGKLPEIKTAEIKTAEIKTAEIKTAEQTWATEQVAAIAQAEAIKTAMKSSLNPAPLTEETMNKAQEILQKATDDKIAQQIQQAKQKVQASGRQTDGLQKKKEGAIEGKGRNVSDIINELKDKKSRGEL